MAAGDISCRPELQETATTCRQARTAALVESLAPDAVAVLGDNQYEHGQFENFMAAYDPTWGRFKAITHPAVGNHEYEGDPERDDASGYFKYFGAAAGDPAKGYYRWTLGDWNVFVLNSGAINYTRDTGLRPELDDDCWPVSCMVGAHRSSGCAPSSPRSRPTPACSRTGTIRASARASAVRTSRIRRPSRSSTRYTTTTRS